ncbi:hypothetical protein QBC44DRAFT_230798 [Cladorrhinum sp. PSN332]|nr:hypothetical protein QBC44DRAFT_230798 [Cladorrhinum sp. PSN332]
MANNTLLTDDYVAELLAEEANDASIKYSSMGLEAFRSTKPSNKAKPNTRFLGRIIKETTNHNAALLAREAAEAQARLDKLTEAEEKKRRKLNPSSSDIRRRQLGDISSILQGRKRRSAEFLPKERRGGSDGHTKGKDDEHTPHRSRRREGEERTTAREHHHHRHRSERSRSPAHRGHKHRDRSPLSSSETEDGHSHHRTKSHQQNKRRSDKDGDRSRNDDLFGSGASKGKGRADHGRLPHDSDPLDEFIGPAPPSISPVRKRGRGAIRGAAAMDSKFSENYDPAADINVDSAATTSANWEDAVEGFRDRQKWKQQGAQRLRAAGFTEEQIKRWEKGGEKDIDDVRWTKAGGQREWDRGKDDST